MNEGKRANGDKGIIEIKLPPLCDFLNQLFQQVTARFEKDKMEREIAEAIGYPEELIKVMKIRERTWKRELLAYGQLRKEYCMPKPEQKILPKKNKNHYE